ncbi:MAG: cytochrome d ubiquinol oxidase subunit II [Parvibaculaceae bacterium]|nr:cytochrome d ubiquinol oxidase subunit II [Parvibaculaceae bacterium]
MELLTLISAAAIAFAILMYVMLDGFDLGVGILFPFAPDDRARSTIMNSVAPIWDGNETWLILGGGGLLVLFPLAYSIALPAFYIPLFTMLLALIFRGVSFEFRHSAHTSIHIWNRAFFGGSLVAAFMQGILVGGVVQGVTVANDRFAGGVFDWFTPFTVLTGLGVVAAYTLLGATWLVMKTQGELADWARRIGVAMGGAMLILLGAISVITPAMHPEIADRWFAGLNPLYVLPVPLLAVLLAAALFYGLLSGKERLPFFCALGLFICAFAGFGISMYPNLLPPSVTIFNAIAPRSSVVFSLIGIAISMPMVLFYTVYAYSVFRGKVGTEGGYAHHD